MQCGPPEGVRHRRTALDQTEGEEVIVGWVGRGWAQRSGVGG